jgi:pimeloyl-ACP methyl ester carboxylesterase
MKRAPATPQWSRVWSQGSYEVRVQCIGGEPDASKPCAIAVHGMADTSQVWAPLLPVLQREHQVFTVDMPWSGRQGADWPRIASPERWWLQVLALLPRPPRLVLGHSFGASVIMEWLPAAGVEAVVLLAPYFKPAEGDFAWSVLDHYVSRFHELLADGIRLRPGASRYTADELHSMSLLVRERIAPVAWMEFFRLFLRSPELPIAQMPMPALLIGGDRDISVCAADVHALGQRWPGAQSHVLEDCGHHALLERPDAVAGLLEDWLARRTWQAAAPRSLYHPTKETSWMPLPQ